MMMPCFQNVESGLANTLDLVTVQLRATVKQISQAFPRVRVLDVYDLTAVSLNGGSLLRYS